MPTMTQAPRLTPAKRPANDKDRAARDERLARALRDNLRRRKEQARGRDAAAEPDPEPPPETAAGDERQP